MRTRFVLILLFFLIGLVPCFAEEFGLYICPDFEEEIDDGKCSFTIPQTDGDSPPILLQQRAIVKVGDVCYDWYDDETESGKLLSSSCNDAHFRCCLEYDKLKDQDETECADKIPMFLKSWKAIGFTYQLMGFDSKRFAEILARFLRNC